MSEINIIQLPILIITLWPCTMIHSKARVDIFCCLLESHSNESWMYKFFCINSQRLKAGKLKTKTKPHIKILHQVDLTRIKQTAILTKWLVCKSVYNPRMTSWVQNAHLTKLSKTFLPYSSSKWLKSCCREVNKINLFHEGSLQLTVIYIFNSIKQILLTLREMSETAVITLKSYLTKLKRLKSEFISLSFIYLLWMIFCTYAWAKKILPFYIGFLGIRLAPKC